MPAPRSTAKVRTYPLGEAALLAELGTRIDTALNTRAIALAAALKKRRDVRQAVAGYATVTVHFHDTIDTKGMTKKDVPALRDRVREIISAPVEVSLEKSA